MCSEAVCKRLPALEHTHNIEHDITKLRSLCQLASNRKGAIQRYARTQQCGKLLRKEQDVAAAVRPNFRQSPLNRLLLLNTHIERNKPLALQLLGDSLVALSRNDTGS